MELGMTIADWIIVGATVVSAISATASAVVAIILWRMVVVDRSGQIQEFTRLAVAGIKGIPISHVHIENWFPIERALRGIAEMIEKETK